MFRVEFSTRMELPRRKGVIYVVITFHRGNFGDQGNFLGGQPDFPALFENHQKLNKKGFFN